MALIPCPDCKKMISPSAPQCPRCGCTITDEYKQEITEKQEKNKKINKKTLLVFSVVVALLAIICTILIPPQKTTTKAIADLIDDTMEKNNFKDRKISVDGDTITISVWTDGIAANVALITLTGGDENNADWVYLKESQKKFVQSCLNLAKKSGRDDITIALNIMNDANRDNILLSFLNTTVIYDVLAK